MLKPEQTLQLQLQVSETLNRHTTRDGIGLALAEVINRIMPFQFFLHSIWLPGSRSGYRISSIKLPDGKFAAFDDKELEKLRETNMEALIESGKFLNNPDNAGIYLGDDLKKLADRFASFQVGYYHHHIRSLMILNMTHENGFSHAMLISDRAEDAFTHDQFQTIRTVLPQIKMAFDNLFKYEQLKHEETNRKVQLEVNNVLLGHTNRQAFGIALAEVINKYVPCERFVLRIWQGEANPGERLPLVRTENGTFKRFSELPVLEQVERDPETMIKGSNFMAANPGIYQGEVLKNLVQQYPFFAVAANAFNMNSGMVLSFKSGNMTCLLIMGNSAAISFHEGQYELMQRLMPQIILAFENLFKYEKMKEEERERKTQLDLMTAFNGPGELDAMALTAIGKMNDFIPFEYWMQISTLSMMGKDLYFRLAFKTDGKFDDTEGEELFKRINHPPIDVNEFRMKHAFLFEKLAIYVGEDFEELRKNISYFNALHETMRLNSLAVFPISMMGSVDTIIMMGSVRQYAFSQTDLESINRIIPYISMAAQQYYSMFHMQRMSEQLQLEKNYLVEEIKSNYNFDEIIGTSHLMKDVFKQITQVASTDSTTLILGETGTGKELIARAIHNQSSRKDKVLIKVNCASLPAQLIESELFGHEKGSFTGALEKRIGKFELANGGTIFLDEMGELPLELQAKLLRVLQEREIERIGGKSTISLDVRVIAATNRDLDTEVAEGRFRSDLFYRLNVFPIHLPPLRERREDIPMLVAHFMQKYSRKMKRQLLGIKENVIQEIMAYDWPGNIRELENVIEQSVIVGDTGSIKLRKSVRRSPTTAPKKLSVGAEESFNDEEIIRVLKMTSGKIVGPEGAAAILNMRPAKIEEYERKWILNALQKTGGRIRGENGAAELIGVKPTTLEARVKKLGITKGEIFAV